MTIGLAMQEETKLRGAYADGGLEAVLETVVEVFASSSSELAWRHEREIEEASDEAWGNGERWAKEEAQKLLDEATDQITAALDALTKWAS